MVNTVVKMRIQQHIPISLLHVSTPPPLQGMVKDNRPQLYGHTNLVTNLSQWLVFFSFNTLTGHLILRNGAILHN